MKTIIAKTKVNELATVTMYEETGDLLGNFICFHIEAVCELSGETLAEECCVTAKSASSCFTDMTARYMQAFATGYIKSKGDKECA